MEPRGLRGQWPLVPGRGRQGGHAGICPGADGAVCHVAGMERDVRATPFEASSKAFSSLMLNLN